MVWHRSATVFLGGGILLSASLGHAGVRREDSDWFAVPVSVVPVGSIEDAESWMEFDGYRVGAEGLQVTARQELEEGTVVSVWSTGDGVRIRLLADPSRGLAATARSSWWTDVGWDTRGSDVDVHGGIEVEAWSDVTHSTLRLRFRLETVRSSSDTGTGTHRLDGVLLVSLSKLFPRPGFVLIPVEDSGEEARGRTHTVETTWESGAPRARGEVDRLGRRQRLWILREESGALLTLSTWRDGTRAGLLETFDRWSPLPEEVGLYREGRRTGIWVEARGQGEERVLTRGVYVRGKKEGKWVGTWQDGTVFRRETFRGGKGNGPFTGYWPSGNLRVRGTQERGCPVGTWTYWNEAGYVTERIERHLLPWVR